MVDATEGILGIEWIDGQSVRRLLPGGAEEEEEEESPADEPIGDIDGDNDPLREYGITIGIVFPHFPVGLFR